MPVLSLRHMSTPSVEDRTHPILSAVKHQTGLRIAGFRLVLLSSELYSQCFTLTDSLGVKPSRISARVALCLPWVNKKELFIFPYKEIGGYLNPSKNIPHSPPIKRHLSTMQGYNNAQFWSSHMFVIVLKLDAPAESWRAAPGRGGRGSERRLDAHWLLGAGGRDGEIQGKARRRMYGLSSA